MVLYGAFMALWFWGPHAVYFGVLRLFAFEPFRFPFLDIHGVLSGAQCYRLGVDVYSANPCDALGRVYDYSPLWLRIVPKFLDSASTTTSGLALGLLFIASLMALCRPVSRRELLLITFVAISPMTVYALERANSDVILFLLVLAGIGLLRTCRPARFAAYALFLFAGLLKILSTSLARHRTPRAVARRNRIGGNRRRCARARDALRSHGNCQGLGEHPNTAAFRQYIRRCKPALWVGRDPRYHSLPPHRLPFAVRCAHGTASRKGTTLSRHYRWCGV